MELNWMCQESRLQAAPTAWSQWSFQISDQKQSGKHEWTKARKTIPVKGRKPHFAVIGFPGFRLSLE
jgi:hypothetical protein